MFYAVSGGRGQYHHRTQAGLADGDIEGRKGITGSTKIIEGSVTADRLNATDIFAGQCNHQGKLAALI